mmetsp:Transcript_28808/g.44286  ORF Transcript_28808/g.44286 Transcript_28808/m.44286 type:complete len:334 (-) Transcript_28808:505-1506(-)
MTFVTKALGVLFPMLVVSALLIPTFRSEKKVQDQNLMVNRGIGIDKVQDRIKHQSVRRAQVGGLMSMDKFPEDITTLNGKVADDDYADDDDDDEEINKIIFGKDAVENGAYPFMAFLRRPTKKLHCGGVLIAPNIVLTAAHCQGGFDQIVLGAHDLNNPSPDQMAFKIEKELVHPEFVAHSFDNDLMLIRLQGNTSGFDPIDMMNDGNITEVKDGDSLKVLGWGKMEDGNMAESLQEVYVTALIDNEKCKTKLKEQWQPAGVLPSMMCAWNEEDKADTCKGDSGGPMFKEMDDSTNILIGIISWGYGDCGGIGIYALISEAYDWIQKFISDNQ